MANVYAVKSGNWSDTTVWNTGALPTTADVAFSNGFIVTIDGTYTVQSIRNAASAPIVAGGYFQPADGSNLTCTVSIPAQTHTSEYYQCALNSPASATFSANITAGVNSNQRCVSHSGSGTLNFNGIITGSTGSSPVALLVSGTGTLNVVGDVRQGTSSSAINATSTATINITGAVGISTTSSAAAITVSGIATVNIVGNVVGSSGTGAGISSTVASNITVTGNILAGATAAISLTGASTLTVTGSLTAAAGPAVSSSSASATNILSGPFLANNTSGMVAFYGPKILLKNTPATYWTFRTQDLLTDRTMYTADYPGDPPAIANVRSGITYGAGYSLTGTMVVPPAASVAFGVPVDNTTGTAALTPANVWNYLTSAATEAGSMGERLKNCSTVATTGDQWAAG